MKINENIPANLCVNNSNYQTCLLARQVLTTPLVYYYSEYIPV